MPAATPAAAPREPRTVLVVDDDPVLSGLVQTVLTDEGYRVAGLTTLSSDAIRTAVGRLEPDCVLLDSRGPTDYGDSWRDAAWARARPRAVPVVMFTASLAAQREAAAGASARSRAAGLFAVLGKPFDLDELVATVARAVGSIAPFDRAGGADARRPAALAAAEPRPDAPSEAPRGSPGAHRPGAAGAPSPRPRVASGRLSTRLPNLDWSPKGDTGRPTRRGSQIARLR
jgi:CheY-like chemotaxis protein